MRRLLLMGLAAGLGFALSRGAAAPLRARLITDMIEHVQPRMMHACFAQMSPARRDFMLAHCRRVLDEIDEIDERYRAAQPA